MRNVGGVVFYHPLTTNASMLIIASMQRLLLALAGLAITTEASAGSAYGPRFASTTIAGGFTHSYAFEFVQGEVALVKVYGHHTTDLDCFMYDGNGIIVDNDVSNSDDCVLSVVPAWSGPFTVRVTNLGTATNAYLLQTN